MHNVVLQGVVIAVPKQRGMRAVEHFVVFNRNANTVNVKCRLISFGKTTEMSHNVVTRNVV